MFFEFFFSDVVHDIRKQRHQYQLKNDRDREIAIQRSAIAYANHFDHFLYSYREHVSLPTLFVLGIVSSVALGILLLYFILYLVSELFKLAITILIL